MFGEKGLPKRVRERRERMKELFGSPGKASGLLLRIGQCLFAAASIGVMASASGFSTATAFW